MLIILFLLESNQKPFRCTLKYGEIILLNWISGTNIKKSLSRNNFLRKAFCNEDLALDSSWALFPFYKSSGRILFSLSLRPLLHGWLDSAVSFLIESPICFVNDSSPRLEHSVMRFPLSSLYLPCYFDFCLRCFFNSFQRSRGFSKGIVEKKTSKFYKSSPPPPNDFSCLLTAI